MYKEKISIIIPVYNAEQYLKKCLESVINQTYDNFEVICVDDTSTDHSLEILYEYQKADARFLVVSKQNEGVSIARNTGMEIATGDYIMFVDADDWIEPETCERVLQVSKENDADVVMWNYIREYGTLSLPKKVFDQDKIVFEEREVREKLHRRFIGLLGEELRNPESAESLSPVWGKLYRREVISSNGVQFTDIRQIGTYEDGIFNMGVFQYVKKAVYINQYLYHYRRSNVHSITGGYKGEFYMQQQQLFSIMREYIDNNRLTEEYNQALRNRISMSILGLGRNVMKDNVSMRVKLKKISQLIYEEQYKTASKTLVLKYFPVHWKVFYGSAKYGLTVCVCVLLWIISRMLNK